MKFPENVRKALDALPQSKRDRVQAIVRRHVNACRRMGVELEFMDRVWLEAIEAVENEERTSHLKANSGPNTLPCGATRSTALRELTCNIKPGDKSV